MGGTGLLLALSALVLVAGTGTALGIPGRGEASSAIHGDGPPPGFSGGFGEQACDACHFSYDLNANPGTLRILGAPSRYVPGNTYALTLELTRPGIEIGGVQLTSRFADGGAQAGALRPGDGEAGRLEVATSFDIEYAQHVRAGTALAAADTARWTVLWTAPEAGGVVQFNAASNAADEDESQFGDYIYTAVERSTH